MKIKARTKDGEIVTIVGANTDGFAKWVTAIDTDGKFSFYNPSWLTVIDEEYLPKEG